jgi:hypothetical protein
MPGVPRELAEHALNVYPDAKPIKQTTRRYSEPKRKAIGVEVNRLLAAKFIREIKHSTWLANPVLVPKKDTLVLRMCIDFSTINKYCPKDHFPCLGSIKSLIRLRDASASPSSTPTQATTRSA